jgi:hypothetical protein
LLAVQLCNYRGEHREFCERGVARQVFNAARRPQVSAPSLNPGEQTLHLSRHVRWLLHTRSAAVNEAQSQRLGRPARRDSINQAGTAGEIEADYIHGQVD